MSELTIESEALRITVRAAEGDAWAALRAAFDAATAALNASPQPFSPPIHIGGENSRGSASERIREIAAGMLADGRSRERREIAKAIRDAGLKTEGLDQALKRDKRFERDHNVMGRPIYRDRYAKPRAAPEPTPGHGPAEWGVKVLSLPNGDAS
jgi:hypothetical protein